MYSSESVAFPMASLDSDTNSDATDIQPPSSSPPLNPYPYSYPYSYLFSSATDAETTQSLTSTFTSRSFVDGDFGNMVMETATDSSLFQDVLTTAGGVTSETSTIDSVYLPPTSTRHGAGFDMTSSQYWQQLLVSFIFDAVRIINFLQDNLDKLLVYLIVSITSSLIIVLVGVTIKIIIARNAKHRLKQSHYAAEGEYMEISIAHNRKPVAAACENGTRVSSISHPHPHPHSHSHTHQQQQQQRTTCAHAHAHHPSASQTVASASTTDRTKHRAQHRRSAHKSISTQHGTNRIESHSTRNAPANTQGLDRVRNQEYVQIPREDKKRKRMSAISSPPNAAVATRNGHANAVTFSQSVNDVTRPILCGEFIPAQNFQVVRFQPQLTNKTGSMQLTTSFHDDDFNDFGE